jgi:hypothetical protein
MISMFVVHPTFKIDVLKTEQAFHTKYRKGDKIFYVLWQHKKFHKYTL